MDDKTIENMLEESLIRGWKFDFTPADEDAYRSYNDIEHPFYVIVHEHQLESAKVEWRSKWRVKRELSHIKRNYDYILGGLSVDASKIPNGREILVCGFWSDMCVLSAYNDLKKKGYEVHISKEGTLSLKDVRQRKSRGYGIYRG